MVCMEQCLSAFGMIWHGVGCHGCPFTHPLTHIPHTRRGGAGGGRAAGPRVAAVSHPQQCVLGKECVRANMLDCQLLLSAWPLLLSPAGCWWLILLSHTLLADVCLSASPSAAHHHFDHVGGNAELKQRFNCTIVGPAADAIRIPGIDVQLKDGDRCAVVVWRGAMCCMCTAGLAHCTCVPIEGQLACRGSNLEASYVARRPWIAGTSWVRRSLCALTRRATRAATSPTTSRPPRRCSPVGVRGEMLKTVEQRCWLSLAITFSPSSLSRPYGRRRHTVQPRLRPVF